MRVVMMTTLKITMMVAIEMEDLTQTKQPKQQTKPHNTIPLVDTTAKHLQ